MKKLLAAVVVVGFFFATNAFAQAPAPAPAPAPKVEKCDKAGKVCEKDGPDCKAENCKKKAPK